MDVLSQILDTVQMRGSLYFPTHFRGAFGLTVPAETNVCRFHVVVEGRCLVGAGGEATLLGRGDLVLVPHGREHTLQYEAESPRVDLDRALEAAAYRGDGDFEWGEGETTCRLVCGHFEFDKEVTHPLLEALPALITVRATPTYDFRWIDQVMRFIGEETHARRPGSEVIARRLSEVLLVQVIRHYAETAEEPVPILAGITDPRLSRVLHAMHTELDRSWTLESLAAEGGMSRTAFALLFSKLIGTTPMSYLTDQRMRAASRLLRAGETAGTVARRVGYRSEAAFSRKFRDVHGEGPGSYRRRASR